LAGILVFTDKLIDRETAGRIRRVIEMTQVAQIFEEVKQQALTQVAQIFEEEKQQAMIEATKNASKQIVIRMIKKDYSSEEIASVVSNYSQDNVESLREELMSEERKRQ
jgi:23S rRNA pseudoU1915 N3-methylase RlmH